jgi:hypothetical protein
MGMTLSGLVRSAGIFLLTRYKFNRPAFPSLVLAVVLAFRCSAQTAAPALLPPCLIQYATSPAFVLQTSSRLVLYNSDKTYVEINSFATGFGFPNPGGEPTHGGTFAYAADPQNPAHARIVYDGGLSSEDLYFSTANSGTQVVPPVLQTVGNIPIFTLYPKQATNGGSNLSNRCQLAAGGAGVSGFVIQSGGPRWVLLRAVGATLGTFGVSLPVSSPTFSLYDSTQKTVGTSSVWSSDPNLVSGFQTIFSLVGGFPLISGSDEGVLLVSLNPGAYTAAFQAGSAGTMLLEVYILPY